MDVEAALFDPQQWNRYAYARNDPLVYVDPTGAAIELVGDADQRQQGLDSICSAVGAMACTYLYENAVTTGGSTRYFVGIRTNGPTGAGPAFGAINSVAQMFGDLIADNRVAQLTIVPVGANIKGNIIGSAPSHNPAVTDPGTYQVFMLDKGSGALGYLPGAYMADGLRSPLDAGLVSAHEFGHLHHVWRNLFQRIRMFESNDASALRMENAVRTLRNPNAVPRKYHNYPRNIGG